MEAMVRFTETVETLQKNPHRRTWGPDSLSVDFLCQRKPHGELLLRHTQQSGRVVSIVNEGEGLVDDFEHRASAGDLDQVGLVVFAHVLHDCSANQRLAIFHCLEKSCPSAVVTFTDYALQGLPLDSVLSCFRSQFEQDGIRRKGMERFLIEHCQFSANDLRDILEPRYPFVHTEPVGAGRIVGIGAEAAVLPGMIPSRIRMRQSEQIEAGTLDQNLLSIRA